MKRLFLFLFVSLISTFSYCQEDDIKCIKFAGVQIGMSYNECISILNNRFTNSSKFEETANGFKYYDVNFIDTQFNDADFSFTLNKNMNKILSIATFSKYYKLKNKIDALLNLAKLKNKMIQKYKFVGERNEKQLIMEVFGNEDGNKIDKSVTIVLSLFNDSENNSVYKLSVIYGDFGTINNENDY